MSFKLDLDKIKAMPDFSKEESIELRMQYEKDAAKEDHSIFFPVIPTKEGRSGELKYETVGKITVASYDNADPLDSYDNKTVFSWNARIPAYV